MTDSHNANPSTNPDVTSTKVPQVVRITTGARLHFGLLDTVVPFGGVGLMVDVPQTEVIATPADRFECDPEVAQCALPIANRIAKYTDLEDLPRCRIRLERSAQPHCGLGSGTQLALAVAESICQSIALTVPPGVLATQLAARGRRSAVGVHGYFGGGLICETADPAKKLNRVQNRVSVSNEWRVGIFRPLSETRSVSGDHEQKRFSTLSAATSSQRESLADLASQMILAAKRCDFPNFASLVQQYNCQSGLLFEAAQGGPYNGDAVTELVKTLCDRGALGIGQSSWGPGVFSWFESEENAQSFSRSLPKEIDTIGIARPLNNGRQLELAYAAGSPRT